MRCCPCTCCSCPSLAWLVPDASPTLVSLHPLTAPTGTVLRDAGTWAHMFEGEEGVGKNSVSPSRLVPFS